MAVGKSPRRSARSRSEEGRTLSMPPLPRRLLVSTAKARGPVPSSAGTNVQDSSAEISSNAIAEFGVTTWGELFKADRPMVVSTEAESRSPSFKR
eukprot:12918621-Prorocentrum_lima.AAC.1